MKSIWNNISNIGLEKARGLGKQKQLQYFNRLLILIIIFFSLASILPYIKLDSPIIGNLLLINVFVALICLALNSINKTLISKFIISIVFPLSIVFISAYSKYNNISDNTIMYLTPRVVMLIGLIIPTLLFGYKEKLNTIIAISPGLIAFIFFDKIHELFGVYLENLEFDVSFYPFYNILIILVLLFVVSSVLFLQHSNFNYERKLQKKTEELITSEEELRQNNEEINALNDNLKSQFQVVKNQEKIFRLLFENSNDAILLLQEEKLYDCNDAALKLLVYSSKQELLKKKAKDLYPKTQPNGESSRELAKSHIEKALKYKINKFEWNYLNKNKEIIQCENLLTPIKINNKTIIHCVIRDLTEQKKAEKIIKEQIDELMTAEEELRQNNEELQALNENISIQNKLINEQKIILEAEREKALNASKYKSIFLANMSHEIRTPLNGIIGMTEILKETNLTKTQRSNLDIIDISGNNLLSIINDILDYSKIEANQLELENVNVNLFKEIEDVVRLLTLKAQSKGLELTCDIHPKVPKYIIGDSLRIKQVLINYCNNSIKFTSKGFVHINVFVIDITDEEVIIRFNVKDTGIGISKENIEKLFKEFSQVNASTTRKFGGTGLGLSIAQKLAELMGGEVGVESKWGEGSLFWFTGKYKIAKDIEIKNDKKDIVISNKILNVLLVEDNKINQKVAMHTLKKHKHNVDIANDGLEALGLFNKNKYDIIFMDIHMPKLNGYETTIEIRKIEKEQNLERTRIAAMTANALKGEKEKCLKIGMDAYLSKPFKIADFLNILNS